MNVRSGTLRMAGAGQGRRGSGRVAAVAVSSIGLWTIAACVPPPPSDSATSVADIGDAGAPDTPGAPPSDALAAIGETVFNDRCASCHLDGANTRAAPLSALATLNPANIIFTLTNGSMRTQAAGLGFPEYFAVAEYIAGNREPYVPDTSRFCADPSIDFTPLVTRWGVDNGNTAALPDGASPIDASSVAGLRLAWAFGLPDVADARVQPVVTENTLFVAATSGHLFALDRRSGCIRWHRALPAPPRTALTLGTVADAPALVFGDTEAHVNAVDAAAGTEIWRVDAALSDLSMLTGATVQYEDRLIVPISMVEVALASDPSYECCHAHGGVIALDADTGGRLWTTHMTEPAEPQGVTSVGTRIWAPSGAPVWSTPTVDEERGLVYVGTGQNASRPATDRSDAVIALDLETGEVVWQRQTIAGDAYNQACDSQPPGPNCPVPAGPDHDIGASVMLTQTAAGRDRLIVGQKSGDVFALDPDREGEIVWRRRVAAGSALGGVHWGMAVADGVVFAPSADPPFPFPNYEAQPGLTALSVDDGSILWESPVQRGCESDFFGYISREILYPDCSFFFALSSPPLVVNDVVFVPALDGKVRAWSVQDGAVLWEVETAREFETVNGVEARGGSIDVAGVQVAGDVLYVQSGYAQFGQLPGNVLLAFDLAER